MCLRPRDKWLPHRSAFPYRSSIVEIQFIMKRVPSHIKRREIVFQKGNPDITSLMDQNISQRRADLPVTWKNGQQSSRKQVQREHCQV